MSNKVKDRWRNVVQFVSASLEQEEDEESREKQDQMNAEMYKRLMTNYNLSPKKKKITIFDFMKSKSINP